MYKSSLILLSTLCAGLCLTQSCPAEPVFSSYTEADYLPYLQLGGNYYFHYPSQASGETNLFLPLLQTTNKSHLLFTQLRICDGSGKPFEGNVHLGYRYLNESYQYLLGFYTSLDRKRSTNGHYFNQVTLGIESWIKQFFIGANYYQPYGKHIRVISSESDEATTILRSEVALPGGDFEIGYELPYGFTIYGGGFYFKAPNTTSVIGPKIRVTYNYTFENYYPWFPCTNLGMEAGYSQDHVRKDIYYLSLNLRFGLKAKKPTLTGIAKHMVDLIHRNPDITLGIEQTSSSQFNHHVEEQVKAAKNNQPPTPNVPSPNLNQRSQDPKIETNVEKQTPKSVQQPNIETNVEKQTPKSVQQPNIETNVEKQTPKSVQQSNIETDVKKQTAKSVQQSNAETNNSSQSTGGALNSLKKFAQKIRLFNM